MSWNVASQPLKDIALPSLHKSKYARHNVPITDRSWTMLEDKALATNSVHTFLSRPRKLHRLPSICRTHKDVRPHLSILSILWYIR